MNDQEKFQLQLSRRTFLGRTASGMGSLALASMLNPALLSAAENANPANQKWHGVVNPLHFKQRCKRIIYLYMAGGPSHLETFDYKPKLAEMNGKPMPESITKGQPIAQLQGQQLKCFAPQHPFAKYGKSQQEICTIFPNIGKRGRRHLHHPLDAHRRDQSRPGPYVHEHRHDDLRPAVDGIVAALWPGQRRRRSARLRRDDLHRQVRPAAADRGPHVAQRLSAEQVSGRASSVRRATRCCISATRRA